jgi:succinate dehydrogenase / fumarate reductase, cytochrome b subunit
MTNAQYFTLRRLHSLLGVFPLGVFLFNHLLTNSSGILGADYFEDKVALIWSLGPLLPIVEAVFIFIPLALHIALGIFIAMQARMEVRGAKEYARNWAYIFQRWTGWIALVFIVWHVITLRFMHDHMVQPFSVKLADMFYDAPQAYFYIPFYFIGSLSVIYHFANGLCTFCMSWGITVGQRSQRYVAWGAGAFGLLLTLMMTTSIFAFWNEGRKMEQMSESERTEYVEYLLSIHEKD